MLKPVLLISRSAALFFMLPFRCVAKLKTAGSLFINSLFRLPGGINFMISDFGKLLLKIVTSYARLLVSVTLYKIAFAFILVPAKPASCNNGIFNSFNVPFTSAEILMSLFLNFASGMYFFTNGASI